MGTFEFEEEDNLKYLGVVVEESNEWRRKHDLRFLNIHTAYFGI